MTIPRIPFSAAASRTSPPAISELMQAALADPGLISLAAGFVDQETLPVDAATAGFRAVFADPASARSSLQYGTTTGDPGLRSRIVDHLERTEGASPGAFESILPRVMITTGSAQLLYLVTEALLDPGDIVLVEAPTYFVFLGVLETRGARAIGIETDAEGMKLDALESTLAEVEARGELDRVKLIYTVSEHANPTGISLAESRRGPLVAMAERWSKRNRIFILEDAAYRGLGFEGADPPSVWSHDAAGETVILARTFSKTFSPGIKLGFGVVPESLFPALHRLKGNHDFGTSNFSQRVLDAALGEGRYEGHVAALRTVYRAKRDAMLEALDTHLGPMAAEGLVSWTRPLGGMFVWLTVPEGLDTGREGPVFARCVGNGVLYVPGAFAYASEPGPVPENQARLCFGVPTPADLAEGVRRLAMSLEQCLEPVAG